MKVRANGIVHDFLESTLTEHSFNLPSSAFNSGGNFFCFKKAGWVMYRINGTTNRAFSAGETLALGTLPETMRPYVYYWSFFEVNGRAQIDIDASGKVTLKARTAWTTGTGVSGFFTVPARN